MLGTLAAPSLLGSCTGSEGDKAAGIFIRYEFISR